MSDTISTHVWAAHIPDAIEHALIFEESLFEDCPSINLFAYSQLELEYDTDFFFYEPVTDNQLEPALRDACIPCEYHAGIQTAWSRLVPMDYNLILFGDEYDFSNPCSGQVGNANFLYLGLFPHWKNHWLWQSLWT